MGPGTCSAQGENPDGNGENRSVPGPPKWPWVPFRFPFESTKGVLSLTNLDTFLGHERKLGKTSQDFKWRPVYVVVPSRAFRPQPLLE